jgi:hypothetical protein
MDAPPAKRQKQKYDYKAEARGEIRRKDPIDSTADGLKGRSNAGEGRAEVAGDGAYRDRRGLRAGKGKKSESTSTASTRVRTTFTPASIAQTSNFNVGISLGWLRISSNVLTALMT